MESNLVMEVDYYQMFLFLVIVEVTFWISCGGGIWIIIINYNSWLCYIIYADKYTFVDIGRFYWGEEFHFW